MVAVAHAFIGSCYLVLPVAGWNRFFDALLRPVLVELPPPACIRRGWNRRQRRLFVGMCRELSPGTLRPLRHRAWPDGCLSRRNDRQPLVGPGYAPRRLVQFCFSDTERSFRGSQRADVLRVSG